jgi:hypothetical protein
MHVTLAKSVASIFFTLNISQGSDTVIFPEPLGHVPILVFQVYPDVP